MSSYNLLKLFTMTGIASPKELRSMANTCGSFTCTNEDRCIEISFKTYFSVWYTFVYIAFHFHIIKCCDTFY
jgi:hypothetical protein